MPQLIDGRDMLPPEPLERTLAALDTLSADDEVILRIHCRPHPLFGILRRERYTWTEDQLPDGSFEFHIRKA